MNHNTAGALISMHQTDLLHAYSLIGSLEGIYEP